MDPFDLRPFFEQTTSFVLALDNTNKNVLSCASSITEALMIWHDIDAYAGASPACVYVIMFTMSPLLFYTSPDRRWLFNAMWARVFDSEYMSTEEGIFNWLAIAINQSAWVAHDGRRLLPFLETHYRVSALFNSLVRLDDNQWEAQFCLHTYETLKVAGSIFYIASLFQSCGNVPDMPITPQLEILLSCKLPSAEVERISRNVTEFCHKKFLRHPPVEYREIDVKHEYRDPVITENPGHRGFTNLGSLFSCKSCGKGYKSTVRLANHELEHGILRPEFKDLPRCWRGECGGKIYAAVRTLKEHEARSHNISLAES